MVNRILTWIQSVLSINVDWARCPRCRTLMFFDHDPGSEIQSTCPKCGHIIYNYENGNTNI